jgi:hypothetical protein
LASAIHTVEASGLARFMREALYAYPGAEVVHIVGLGLLFGSIAIVDLRLLGLGRAIPLGALVRFAVPWSLAGFVVAALSGSLMFVAHVDEFLTQPVFLAKMSLIVLAGLNALALHRGALRHAGAFETGVRPPPRIRAAAAVSLALWLAVIGCGRFLAYL